MNLIIINTGMNKYKYVFVIIEHARINKIELDFVIFTHDIYSEGGDGLWGAPCGGGEELRGRGRADVPSESEEMCLRLEVHLNDIWAGRGGGGRRQRRLVPERENGTEVFIFLS